MARSWRYRAAAALLCLALGLSACGQSEVQWENGIPQSVEKRDEHAALTACRTAEEALHKARLAISRGEIHASRALLVIARKQREEWAALTGGLMTVC